MQTYLFLDVFRLYSRDNTCRHTVGARSGGGVEVLFIVLDQLNEIITVSPEFSVVTSDKAGATKESYL